MNTNNSRKRFTCSYDRVELIISYVCNMKCNNCDALVPQAPSKDSMTVVQIKKFIQESIDNNVEWKHIRILGGEPTLHKDIFEFLALLLDYRKNYSPNTKIQLITNGHGPVVNKLLERIPKDIEIENSMKTSNIQPTFSTVNVAPIDLDEYKNSDFSKGCWIPSLCGIALDAHGYYSCSSAAAMDRVFGFNLGLKEMPVNKGSLEKMFPDFCKLCGHFYDKINMYAAEDITTEDKVNKFEELHKIMFEKTISENNTQEQIYSKTWKEAITKYKKNKPHLTSYV